MERTIEYIIDIINNQGLHRSKQLFAYDDKPIDIYLFDKSFLPKVKIIWNYLETQIDVRGITCTWDWVSTWLEQYHDLVDYWFCVGMSNGSPCGITLVTKETHRPLPLPIKSFHIGTNGEPYKDQIRPIYNKILVKEDKRLAFCQSLVAYLQKNFRCEEITFDDYNSQDLLDFAEELKKNGLNVVAERNVCRYFDLRTARQGHTEILSALSHETRYTVRRSIKAFENDLITEWAETPQQAKEILDELIDLYQKHWTNEGKKGMFASSRFTSFQYEIIKKLFYQGSVILFRVKSKKYGTLGCLYLFSHKGVCVGYQAGFNDFANVEFTTINKKRLRTGFIVHILCMEECMKRGMDIYNFGVGEYQYKRELTNAHSEVVTLSVRKNFKPLLRDTIIELYHKVDENKHGSLILKPLRSML